MKFSLLFVAGLVALTASSVVPPKVVTDKAVLQKQKQVLELVYHIHQSSRIPVIRQAAESYKIEDHVADYKDQKVVEEFIHLYRRDFIRQREVYSMADRSHYEQTVALYRLFRVANNYETFYKTAAWARQNVNGELFVHSFTLAVFQRPDTKGLVFPPIYEILPHYFHNSEVIHEAGYYKQAHVEQKVDGDNKKFNGVTVNSNYSGWYLNLHPEQSLSYYLEDIDLNANYYYIGLHFPLSLTNEQLGLKGFRRGDWFFYRHQQILARYNLERLSNGLGEVEPIDFDVPVQVPYTPSLVYPNGLEFPSRPSNVHFHGHDLLNVKHSEFRIIEAIDSALIIAKNGSIDKLEGEHGAEILGNLVENNAENINDRYYGPLASYYRRLVGFSPKPYDIHRLQPSALEHLETTLRDPGFYNGIRRVLGYFYRYYSYIRPYSKSDLALPGVEVTKAEVDPLITYFDYFYSDLTNAIYYNHNEPAASYHIRARQERLNHKPFSYKLNVKADKDQQVVVKAFLGPKYDEYGRHVNFTKGRYNFVELDRHIHDLKSGENVVERSSHEFSHSGPDRVSGIKLYNDVQAALDRNEEFHVDYRQNFFIRPCRLALPRGTEEGTTYQFYFFVYPYVASEVSESVPILIDNHPFGYPLEREVKFDWVFEHLPNAHFHEVQVFHKDIYEINSTEHHH